MQASSVYSHRDIKVHELCTRLQVSPWATEFLPTAQEALSL